MKGYFNHTWQTSKRIISNYFQWATIDKQIKMYFQKNSATQRRGQEVRRTFTRFCHQKFAEWALFVQYMSNIRDEPILGDLRD